MYVTNSKNPLIVFERRAATRMEYGLKLLSFFENPEGTESFPEEVSDVYFQGFHAGEVSGSSWMVFGSFTRSK